MTAYLNEEEKKNNTQMFEEDEDDDDDVKSIIDFEADKSILGCFFRHEKIMQSFYAQSTC